MQSIKPRIKAPDGITDYEWRLLRLFRCLSAEEQDDLVLVAFENAAKERALDWLEVVRRGRNTTAPRSDEDLDSRVLAEAPIGWLGHALIDWDAVGDPNFCIEQCMGDDTARRVVANQEVEGEIDLLVEAFIEGANGCSNGYWDMIVADLENEEQRVQLEEALAMEMKGFLCEWAERMVETIEAHTANSRPNT